jgi:hypothetical protein
MHPVENSLWKRLRTCRKTGLQNDECETPIVASEGELRF